MCVAESFSGVDMGRRDEVMLLVVSVLVLKLVVDRWDRAAAWHGESR